MIKPKKFDDDGLPDKDDPAAATPVKPTPSSNSAAVPGKGAKEPRKMWVQVKATGDMLEINLDHDRPANFDSKEAEVQWERATAKNALKFKEKVESGVFIPEEILKKLNDKVERTEQEEEILKKEKKLSLMNEKVNKR